MRRSEVDTRVKELFACAPFLLAYWSSLAAGFWVYDTLTAQRLPTADIGQWIMYSRYYLGESTPAYRVPLGVSPLLPLTLALVTRLSNDSIQSGVLVSSVLFFLLSLTVFWVVRELFQDDIAAVAAVLLTSFSQYFFVYLTAFGGLPQLGAIVSLNIGVLALAKIGRNPLRNAGWLLLALSCFLVSFFHFPSAPLFLTSVVVSLFFLALDRQNSQDLRVLVLRACKYLSFPMIAWILYFLLFFDQVIEYAANRAGYYRRGIDTLGGYFTVNSWFLAIAILAISCLAFVLVLALRRGSRYFRKSVGLTLIWFIVPIIFMVVSHLFKAGTEYHRFIFYFIEPPLFALAYSSQILVQRVFRPLFHSQIKSPQTRLTWIGNSLVLVIVLGTLVVLVNSTRFTMRFYPDSLGYFSVEDSSSALDAISWLKTTRNTETVVAPFLEAMWIEGLSGQATLFSNQFRFLYRPGEIDRSLAADLITTGSDIALENGFVYLRFQQIPNGIPFNPNISIYHQGEYADLFTLQDRLITIDANIDEINRKFNLDHDFSRSPRANLVNDGTNARVTSKYFSYLSTLSTPELTVAKTTVVSMNSPDVRIELEFATNRNAKIEGVSFQFADVAVLSDEETVNAITSNPINRTDIASVKPEFDKVAIFRKEADGSHIVADLVFTPSPSRLTPMQSEIVVNGESYLESIYLMEGQTNVSIQMTIMPQVQGHFREGLRTYSALDLLRTYDVGYLVINQTSNSAQAVYDTLKFPRVYNNADYVVYRVPKD